MPWTWVKAINCLSVWTVNECQTFVNSECERRFTLRFTYPFHEVEIKITPQVANYLLVPQISPRSSAVGRKLKQCLCDHVNLPHSKHSKFSLIPILISVVSDGSHCHLFSCASVSVMQPFGDQSGKQLHWCLVFIYRVDFHLNPPLSVVFHLAGWREEFGSGGQQSHCPFQKKSGPVVV